MESANIGTYAITGVTTNPQNTNKLYAISTI